MARKPTRIAPPAIIAQAASALYAQCEQIADEERRQLAINAVTKAFNQLMDGVRIDREPDGTFVFPSRSRAGLSHHVNGVCDCEAWVDNKEPCWQRAGKQMVLIIEDAARPDPIPTAPPPAAPVSPPPPPAPRGPGRNPLPALAAPAAIDAPTIPTQGKAIIFDDETRDFAMFYDGALIGYRARYRQAEQDLDDYVYLHLRHAI